MLAERRQEEPQRAHDHAGLEARQLASPHGRVLVDGPLGPLDAATDRAEDVLYLEVAAHVQLRGEADLGVEDVLSATV